MYFIIVPSYLCMFQFMWPEVVGSRYQGVKTLNCVGSDVSGPVLTVHDYEYDQFKFFFITRQSILGKQKRDVWSDLFCIYIYSEIYMDMDISILIDFEVAFAFDFLTNIGLNIYI